MLHSQNDNVSAFNALLCPSTRSEPEWLGRLSAGISLSPLEGDGCPLVVSVSPAVSSSGTLSGHVFTR